MKKSLLKFKIAFLFTALLIGSNVFATDIYVAAAEEILVASASVSDTSLTPSMDFTPYTNKSLVFSYAGSGSSGGTLTVAYSTDFGASWTPLTSLATTTTSYKVSTIDLSAITGSNVIVGFLATTKSIKIKLITISSSDGTGINENAFDKNVSIEGKNIELSDLDNAVVSIYNISGALILSKEISGNASITLGSGLYLLNVSSNGINSSKKICIK